MEPLPLVQVIFMILVALAAIMETTKISHKHFAPMTLGSLFS
jgi:hypothetical protein